MSSLGTKLLTLKYFFKINKKGQILYDYVNLIIDLPTRELYRHHIKNSDQLLEK